MKTEKILIILALFVVMLIALSSISPDFFKGFTTGSIVTSVSNINYQSNTGEVKSGYLYGGKVVMNIVLDNAPLEILFKNANKEFTWGDYKIKPQNNVLVKISANNRAKSALVQYSKNYYDSWSGMLSTKELKGTSWVIETPIHIEVYADSKAIPTTPVLIKDIPSQDFKGQQLVTLNLGNGINLQKVGVMLGDNLLYSANSIVVATSPNYPDFQTKVPESKYLPKVTYLFDIDQYNTQIDEFHNTIGTQFVGANEPLLALWSGWDSGAFGYSRFAAWKGLPTEIYDVAPASAIGNVKYDPSTQNITVDPLQYYVSVNLELPSEIVKSLAILRGAGIPIVTFSYPVSLSQGTQKYLDVNVKNIGDSDTFNIVPTSKSGKLIFTPSSLSAYINTGETKTFKFVTGITGQETSLASATESTEILVTPQHNLEARVTESFSTAITYKVTSETSPDTAPTSKPPADIKPSNADTMDLNQSIQKPPTVQKWYENPWFGIGIIITIISGLYYISTKKK